MDSKSTIQDGCLLDIQVKSDRLLGVFKETSGSLPSWAAFVLFIVVFMYQAWLAIAMWRCAPNVKHRAFYFLGRLFAAFQVLMLLAAALQFLKGAP